ncbi:hypothetical protein SK128_002804 [Halocaridina rubra]|uniref:Longitudinals lacking protein n=1 Tax=Halocaridina rubra TaxID=373956 RepID=A0AAN9A9I7_HALRR
MAADGLLLLSWKNHSGTFLHVISSLREKGLYTDVTVACDGKFYPAHKIVLSACSQYFEEMLKNTPCKHPVIVLKDIGSQELDALLSYMYAGEVSVSQHQLTALIKAAESLHIKGLAVPDEVCNESEKRGHKMSPERRYSPSPKRQRRERANSPIQDMFSSQTTEASASNVPDSSRESSPTYSSTKRSQVEEYSAVKTEPSSLPSSPNYHLDEEYEQSSNSNAVDGGGGGSGDAPGSLLSTSTRRRSVSGYPSQDSYGIQHKFKEEVLERSSSGPPTEVCFTSPANTSVKIPSEASSNQGASAGTGVNMDSQIRSLLFDTAKRRELFHGESSVYQTPGPSGLMNTLSINAREGFQGATENYSGKKAPPEGYTNLPGHLTTSHIRALPPTGTSSLPVGETSGGGPRSHLTNEACSFQPQSKDSDVARNTHTEEGPDQAGNSKPQDRFRCRHCHYKGQSFAMYIQHMRIHTGEKPFVCPFCSFRSGRKSVVTKHLKTQHNWD